MFICRNMYMYVYKNTFEAYGAENAVDGAIGFCERRRYDQMTVYTAFESVRGRRMECPELRSRANAIILAPKYPKTKIVFVLRLMVLSACTKIVFPLFGAGQGHKKNQLRLKNKIKRFIQKLL